MYKKLIKVIYKLLFFFSKKSFEIILPFELLQNTFYWKLSIIWGSMPFARKKNSLSTLLVHELKAKKGFFWLRRGDNLCLWFLVSIIFVSYGTNNLFCWKSSFCTFWEVFRGFVGYNRKELKKIETSNSF